MHRGGRRNSKTYQAWADMKQRCNNSNVRKFPIYGGLDIGYPSEWADFKAFLADMGEAPVESVLDRKDSSRDYSKENCRWATKRESQLNSSRIQLTERKVQLLRALIRATRPGISLQAACRVYAKALGVSFQAAYTAGRGRSWPSVS